MQKKSISVCNNGSNLCTICFKTDEPIVGLLSNGEEDSKEMKLLKEQIIIKYSKFCWEMLRGSDIFKGTVDVVVCDGFCRKYIIKNRRGCC